MSSLEERRKKQQEKSEPKPLEPERFVRKTIQFNFIDHEGDPGTVDIQVQPLGYKDVDNLLGHFEVLRNFNFTAQMVYYAKEYGPLEKGMKKRLTENKVREDALRVLILKHGGGMKGLSHGWAEKCLSCSEGKNCLYLLFSEMAGKPLDKAIPEAAYKALKEMSFEEVFRAVDAALESLGITEEAFIKGMNEAYKACQNGPKQCKKIKLLSCLDDLHGQIFGVCGDCPVRLPVLTKAFCMMIETDFVGFHENVRSLLEDTPVEEIGELIKNSESMIADLTT